MVAVRSIPNEVANQVIYAGTETVPGTAAAATYRWTGTLAVSKSQPLNRTEETTGGVDRLVTPRRQRATLSGTYAEPLTFESLPMLMQYGLRSGKTGVSDGNTTPGYTYDKSPASIEDDIATATLRHNVPGLGFLSTGVRFNEWTIGISDTEDTWQFSSNLFLRKHQALTGSFEGVATGGSTTTIVMSTAGWTVDQWEGAYVFLDYGTHVGPIRQVDSNTADTLTLTTALDTAVASGDTFRIEALFPSGIAIPRYEAIPYAGTKLYLDPTGSIGTTQVLGRFISGNVTVQHNLAAKVFAENAADEVSDRTGRGGRFVSGSIRLEFDRRDEMDELENMDELAIRIEQEGSVIDSSAGTHKLARLDINRALWDTASRDTRDNNLTATFGFVAYLDDTDPILNVVAKNTLATLP